MRVGLGQPFDGAFAHPQGLVRNGRLTEQVPEQLPGSPQTLPGIGLFDGAHQDARQKTGFDARCLVGRGHPHNASGAQRQGEELILELFCRHWLQQAKQAAQWINPVVPGCLVDIVEQQHRAEVPSARKGFKH